MRQRCGGGRGRAGRGGGDWAVRERAENNFGLTVHVETAADRLDVELEGVEGRRVHAGEADLDRELVEVLSQGDRLRSTDHDEVVGIGITLRVAEQRHRDVSPPRRRA
jgi:hypothetical protein